MNLLKTVAAAFSMFSRLPMPQFHWNKTVDRFFLCAFPLVGAVIGVGYWLWFLLYSWLGLNNLLWGAGLCLLPVLITGGIHLDGFVDAIDAFSSHADRQKKLQILSDPHIGAFAAIGLGCWFVASFALCASLDWTLQGVLLLGGTQVLGRALSGLCILSLPKARADGMAHTFAQNADGRAQKGILLGWAILAALGMVLIAPVPGAIMVAVGTGWLFCFLQKVKKELGGITGDLAGYFLEVWNLMLLLTLVLVQHLIGG